MKLLVTILFIFFYSNAQAQPPVKSSVQQNVSFKLMDLSIVERLEGNTTTAEKKAPIQIQSADKWLIKTKKITASDFNFLSSQEVFASTKMHAGVQLNAQLHTLSKP